MGLRNYVIVATIPSLEVKAVFESEVEQEDNISSVAQGVTVTFGQAISQYPRSAYDIILARGEDLQSVKMSLPELRGWERVVPVGIGNRLTR